MTAFLLIFQPTHNNAITNANPNPFFGQPKILDIRSEIPANNRQCRIQHRICFRLAGSYTDEKVRDRLFFASEVDPNRIVRTPAMQTGFVWDRNRNNRWILAV